jgi:hypothetical protein
MSWPGSWAWMRSLCWNCGAWRVSVAMKMLGALAQSFGPELNNFATVS